MWALGDHEQTIRDAIDSSGNVELHREYDSFGNITSETGAADLLFAFTGRLLDKSTGNQKHGQRWYDPLTGSWPSEDPIGFTAGDMNLYRYVGNNPVNNIDPSGLDYSGFAGSIMPGYQYGGTSSFWQTVNSTPAPSRGVSQETVNEVYDYTLALGDAYNSAKSQLIQSREDLSNAWFFTSRKEEAVLTALRESNRLQGRIDDVRQFLGKNPSVAKQLLGPAAWGSRSSSMARSEEAAKSILASRTDFLTGVSSFARSQEWLHEGAIHRTLNPAEFLFVAVATPTVMLAGTASRAMIGSALGSSTSRIAAVETSSIIIGAEARPIISQYMAGLGIQTQTGTAISSSLLRTTGASTLSSATKGVAFEGTLYRAVKAGYDPKLIHRGNIAAAHRFSGPGQGALYTSTGQNIVRAEFVNNGASMSGTQLHQWNAKLSSMLDLTDPAVRNAIGVHLEDLVRTGGTSAWRYEVTQPLGAWARQQGYNGVIAPSAQASGGVNAVLFNSGILP